MPNALRAPAPVASPPSPARRSSARLFLLRPLKVWVFVYGSASAIGKVSLIRARRRLIQLFHAIANDIVPTRGCTLLPRFPAADIKMGCRARQRDIEKTAVFFQLLLPRRLPQSLERPALGARGDIKRHVFVVPQESGDILRARRKGSIGQKHDRRFEPFGGVHRHDAHLAAAAVIIAPIEFALDLSFRCHQPMQKALQRRRMAVTKVLRRV